jgi:cyanophycinase-like exopeptidase
VWFTGGRHWNIVDSYAGTLTYKEFHKVLERGGVIGGSSAGATIQGACSASVCPKTPPSSSRAISSK